MRQAWKHIAASLVIGALIGAALSCFWTSRQRSSRHGWGEKHYSRTLERFNSGLNLDAEQKTKVAAILEKKRARIKELRAKIHPKFKRLRKATREEIRAILEPAQQKEFDVMQSEWEARWKKRRSQKK